MATAQQKFTAARTSLILDQPFFGALALSLIPKEDVSCPTAWTDGRHMGYNPKFVESLSHAELTGLICHEVMHCLAPETEVLTEKGLRPIAEIQPGDRVWGRGSFATCNAIGSREYSGEIIRLRGAFGPSIRITPNHGVLCLRTEPGTLKSVHGIRKSLRLAGSTSESVSFLPAGELDSSRDLLAFSVPSVATEVRAVMVGRTRKNYTQHAIHFDEDIAYLTGLFIADGNLAKPCNIKTGGWFGAETSKRVICITMHEDEDSTRIEGIITKKLHRKPTVYALKGKRAKRLYVSAKTFANFLQRNFYDGKFKSIPSWLIDQPESIIRSFVDGLVQGDGHTAKTRTTVTTIFPQIAGVLPMLLMRLGIFPSLTKAERTNGFPNAKPAYCLSWEPNSSQVVRMGDYWLVRITECEREDYSGDVHNFSTCQERYSVPFFTVHNCAMGHIFRRDAREPRKFNRACDYAINGDLKASGFSLPKDGLFPDATQLGKSAEWIYARLPDEPQDKNGKGKPDPAGEVRDAPTGTDEDGNPAPTEGEWKQKTAEALQAAKMAGQLSAGLSRMVEAALDKRIDLKSLLLRFFTERTRADFNWNMPSRRYAHMGLYLPSLESVRMGEVAILCDTSGSVTGPALQRARGFLEECLDEVQPSGVTLYMVDTKVHSVHRMEPGDPLTWEPKGFGGTDFTSFFNEVEKSDNPPVCIIGISDLAASFGTAPSAPVLWLTDTQGGTAPFGEVIYCDY